MNDFFIKTVTTIKKNLQGFFNEQFKRYNLNSSEIFIMHLLDIKHSLSQIELANILECNKSHVNRIVSKLIDKKLIFYSQNVPLNIKHCRNATLLLTEYGKSLAKKFTKIIFQTFNSLNKDITKEEGLIAKQVLIKILNNSYDIKLNGETIND